MATPTATDRERVELLRSLGLGRYEAATLVALVKAGWPCTSKELGLLAGVPRTSIYGAANRLIAKGLAMAIDDQAVTQWRSADWAGTLARLRSHLIITYRDRLALLDQTAEVDA